MSTVVGQDKGSRGVDKATLSAGRLYMHLRNCDRLLIGLGQGTMVNRRSDERPFGGFEG